MALVEFTVAPLVLWVFQCHAQGNYFASYKSASALLPTLSACGRGLFFAFAWLFLVLWLVIGMWFDRHMVQELCLVMQVAL